MTFYKMKNTVLGFKKIMQCLEEFEKGSPISPNIKLLTVSFLHQYLKEQKIIQFQKYDY